MKGLSTTALRKSAAVISAAIIIVLSVTSCSDTLSRPVSKTEVNLLGTTCTLTLYDKEPDGIFDKVFGRLHEIEQEMTLNGETSQIIAVNDKAGIAPVEVSADTFDVVTKALAFAKLSGGAFDPSVGPLVKLWGIGTDHEKLPTQQEIEARLPLIDYRKVQIDAEKKTVFLEKKGMVLDLGGIAKGYAADEAARILRENGVGHAIIDFGGNILAFGTKLDGSDWRIGIQNPEGERGSYIGVLQVTDKTIVTSGVYERFFMKDGRRYHHILDTTTGYPVRNGLTSVSIITTKSMTADALSTSAFSLGLEKGMQLIESLEGVEAIFVTEDRNVYITSGLKGNFNLIDDNFKQASLTP